VFVTAEYNYGYPAALKNAIDFLHAEWRHKALGFVSYGGIAAGTRAVQQLRQVTSALGLVSAQMLVNIAFVGNRIGEDGELTADDAMAAAATGMLDELLELNRALALLRR
jgi:NAD(P)H-dependent FMN reductase